MKVYHITLKNIGKGKIIEPVKARSKSEAEHKVLDKYNANWYIVSVSKGWS